MQYILLPSHEPVKINTTTTSSSSIPHIEENKITYLSLNSEPNNNINNSNNKNNRDTIHKQRVPRRRSSSKSLRVKKDIIDVSLTERGLNIAYNVMNEIIRLVNVIYLLPL